MPNPVYDLFRIEANGIPIWCDACESFEYAKRRATELATLNKASHLISDRLSGTKLTIHYSNKGNE
jgi:hypothetical protein